MIPVKQLLSLTLTSLLTLGLSSAAVASDVSDEFDSLGSNDEIIQRARALDPHNRVRIVQNRQVDRYNRVEFAFRGGLVTGGQSYLETNEYGGTVTYHLTPRWSIGGTYNTYRYGLTAEGQKRFQEGEEIAKKDFTDYDVPQLNYPKNSYTMNLSWYPLYGKTNLFDITTAQFDVYVQGGIGRITLESPYQDASMAGTTESNLYSIGTGIGLWLSQHITTRFEIRHEMYKDEVLSGERDLNWTTISTSIGILL